MFLLSIHLLAFVLQASVFNFVFIGSPHTHTLWSHTLLSQADCDNLGGLCWAFVGLDGLLFLHMLTNNRVENSGEITTFIHTYLHRSFAKQHLSILSMSRISHFLFCSYQERLSMDVLQLASMSQVGNSLFRDLGSITRQLPTLSKGRDSGYLQILRIFHSRLPHSGISPTHTPTYTPPQIMYAFWMGRGARELFKDATKKVTVESLIFCDIALHVMFDLLDCVVKIRTHTHTTNACGLTLAYKPLASL